MNKIELLGRLTADPELKTVEGGINMVRFCVAVDRRFSKPEDKKADFINCTAWRKTAEFICKYFKKGQFIGVCGSLHIDSWEDINGKMKYAANVAVDEVYFGGGSNKKDEDYSRKTDNSIASDSVQSTNADNENWVNMEISDDDLPF